MNKIYNFCEMKIHIGKEIALKFQESGLKMPFFADLIATGERNVYSLFNRPDISAEMLTKISKALNFNFFSLYEAKLPDNIASEPNEKYSNNKFAKEDPEEGHVNMTISFNISSPMDKMEKITELISLVNNEAKKMGFKLK